MAGRKKKSPQKPIEEVAEDYCFICKDGGELLICEYKQCLKTYHFNCVEKDASFLTSNEKWACDWHSCVVCHKRPEVQCYCCPKATCLHCICVAELVTVKGMFGFCSNCLKLALLIEENKDADSDGEKVDFDDHETYEGLFMEYYKIIREKEGFNADDVHAAKNRLKTGKNILSESEADDFEDEEEEEVSSNEDMDNKRGYKRCHKNKRFKNGPPVMQCKSKRMEFCGWGSTCLIQFLKSIGKDTSEKLSQHDVYFIICKYIKEKNLPDPTKKKMIRCDENLQSIFCKKTVNKNKIFGLLEAHFVENIEESEEEDAMYNLQCEGKTGLVPCKTRKISITEKASPKRDAINSVPHSCFASVTAENIRHVYLKRSLVYELSKQPESFERKVIGSFVRIKSDPHDFYQRNSHQLVQVTGIMKSVTSENYKGRILCVSRIPKEINIDLLSDADFAEEECEDLRRRIKDGLVQKPTVVELQEKARSLHVDITKHWIARELKILDQRKDQANEKGWRREFFVYIERKNLLQTPEEQSRLLENYPIVIPEVVDVEPKNQDTMDEASPQLITSRNHDCRLEAVVGLESIITDTMDEEKGDEALTRPIFPTDPSDKSEGNGASNAEDEEYHAPPPFVQEGKQNLHKVATPVSPHNSTTANNTGELKPSILEKRGESERIHDQHEVTSQIDVDTFASSSSVSLKQVMFKKPDPTEPVVEVIELDTGSDGESRLNTAVEQKMLEDPESCVWLISGPDGISKMRRYSLSLLKRWSMASNYAFQFKVRKEGQSKEQAIPLGDAIKLASPLP